MNVVCAPAALLAVTEVPILQTLLEKKKEKTENQGTTLQNGIAGRQTRKGRASARTGTSCVAASQMSDPRYSPSGDR